MIWGAAYTLWMVKRVYFGPSRNDHVRDLIDINTREFAMLACSPSRCSRWACIPSRSPT